MSDKAKSRLMIAGAALCAALFLFSGAMLAREYLDQKQSAEAFAEVADLIKEDVEPPTLELADDPAPKPEELTAFEKYADVYAQNSDLVGWISMPGTRIDYPVMQTKDCLLYTSRPACGNEQPIPNRVVRGQCKSCPHFYCRLWAGHWHLSLIPAQLPQGRRTRLRQMGRSVGRE